LATGIAPSKSPRPLRGRPAWRVRVGDCRIIYTIEDADRRHRYYPTLARCESPALLDDNGRRRTYRIAIRVGVMHGGRPASSAAASYRETQQHTHSGRDRRRSAHRSHISGTSEVGLRHSTLDPPAAPATAVAQRRPKRPTRSSSATPPPLTTPMPRFRLPRGAGSSVWQPGCTLE